MSTHTAFGAFLPSCESPVGNNQNKNMNQRENGTLAIAKHFLKAVSANALRSQQLNFMQSFTHSIWGFAMFP